MTLENLLKTGQLKRHEPEAGEVRRLLDAARRNLADSAATNISPENRFDAAYKAIMQSALVALMANGLIPDKKQPVKECRAEAKKLLGEVEAWLRKNHPRLAR